MMVMMRMKSMMMEIRMRLTMMRMVMRMKTRLWPPAGSAVVDWLVFSGAVLSRADAVTLASAVMEEGFVRPLGHRSVEALRTAGLTEQFLDDSSALYCFVSG